MLRKFSIFTQIKFSQSHHKICFAILLLVEVVGFVLDCWKIYFRKKQSSDHLSPARLGHNHGNRGFCKTLFCVKVTDFHNPTTKFALLFYFWSRWWDLNPRPHGPEPCALAPALHLDADDGIIPPNKNLINKIQKEIILIVYPKFICSCNKKFVK